MQPRMGRVPRTYQCRVWMCNSPGMLFDPRSALWALGTQPVRQLQEFCRDLRIQGASPAPAPASTTETLLKESADVLSEKPAPAQERARAAGEA